MDPAGSAVRTPAPTPSRPSRRTRAGTDGRPDPGRSAGPPARSAGYTPSSGSGRSCGARSPGRSLPSFCSLARRCCCPARNGMPPWHPPADRASTPALIGGDNVISYKRFFTHRHIYTQPHTRTNASSIVEGSHCALDRQSGLTAVTLTFHVAN